MRPLMEVCIDSIESAVAAIDGGVDRLEACSSLAIGGLTPTIGLLHTMHEKCQQVPLFAMVRPRAGDFCYSKLELKQMKSEITVMKEHKVVDGFVLGVLLPDGTVDKNSCKTLLNACSPYPVTFHRAFDVCVDPFAAMETIIELGFKRILTSGQQNNAASGIDVLKKLVDKAGDKIVIMPGCGVNSSNLESILRETKAKEFHSSASKTFESKMQFRKETVTMGKDGSEYCWSTCDTEKVRCMLAIADCFHA